MTKALPEVNDTERNLSYALDVWTENKNLGGNVALSTRRGIKLKAVI